MKFRAVLSPSQKIHIVQDEQFLTLCEKTSAIRGVTGSIHPSRLCTACIFAMARAIRRDKQAGGVVPKCDTPEGLAQAIGLESFLT